MYLTKIELDTNIPLDTEILHSAVYRAQAEGEKRLLWKAYSENEKMILLVKSEKKLDVLKLTSEVGLQDSGEEKEINTDWFQDGTMFKFDLTVNNLRHIRRPRSEKERNDHTSYVPNDGYPREWLEAQAKAHGFAVGMVQCQGKPAEGFYKANGKKIKVPCMHYAGILCVTDSKRFKEAWAHGFGRSKAYGRGLMLLEPAI